MYVNPSKSRLRPLWRLLVGGLLLLSVGLLACGPSTAQIKERKDKARYRYQLAHGYYFNKRAPNAGAAIQELVASLELNDADHEAHLLMGLILMGRKDLQDALTHFKRSLEIKPNYYYASNNLGTTYLALERWDDGIAIFELLASNMLYNRQGHAHNNLGWAWYKKGDEDKARRHFMTAITLSPNLCPPYNNLGLLHLEHDRLEKAEKYLTRGLKRCPTYAEMHYHLGRLRLRQGAVEPARMHFEKCGRYGGESPLADRCALQLKTLPPKPAKVRW